MHAYDCNAADTAEKTLSFYESNITTQQMHCGYEH